MMNKILMIISALVLSMLLASCSPVESPYIIGERTVFSENEIGSESVWEIKDQIFHVKIINSNEVVATEVDWDPEERVHKMETHDIIVTELDDHLFLNIRNDEEGLYYIHRIVRSDKHSIVFYSFDEEEIEKHISSGKVHNRTDGGVVLKGTKEEIDKFIIENIRTIYDLDSVIVAKLISGEL